MEHFYKLMVEIDVLQVIKLLKHKMAWIVKDVTAGMFARSLVKTFKCNTIMKIFSWMYFITNVHASLIKGI